MNKLDLEKFTCGQRLLKKSNGYRGAQILKVEILLLGHLCRMREAAQGKQRGMGNVGRGT